MNSHAQMRHPLHSIYSFLFFVSIVVIFLQLLGSIARIFQSSMEFGAFGVQFLIVTIIGAAAGFFHHWNAYRDLGHIGNSPGTLENALPHWVNTKSEFYLRVTAIAFMLLAFSKGQVLFELADLALAPLGYHPFAHATCQVVRGVCMPAEDGKGQQTLFLVFGMFLSIVLLSWSVGAYRAHRVAASTVVKINEVELRRWIVTDALAVVFWLLFVLLVLLELKAVAFFLSITSVLYGGVILWRFVILRRRAER